MQYPTYLKTISTKKRGGRLKLILLAVFIVFFCIKIYSLKVDIYGGGGGDLISVEIKEDSAITQIAEDLKALKIIKYPRIFTLYARIQKRAERVQLGVHSLTRAMSYTEIMDVLTEISTPANTVIVTIPEGSELSQTVQKIKSAFLQKGFSFDPDLFLSLCDSEEFDYPFTAQIKRKENRLEGYLFPATYSFLGDMTEYDIINEMLLTFAREYTEEFSQRAAELGFSTDEVITLASIIEREGAGAEDFKTVSSVFHNRLKEKMRLESCATVQYVLGERKEVLSTKDTKIQSAYNTYLNFGLPAGPIASPGVAAIEAALYPDDTDYLYFRVNEGKHVFSRTFREHQQAAR